MNRFYKCETSNYKVDRCPLCERFEPAFGCCSDRRYENRKPRKTTNKN